MLFADKTYFLISHHNDQLPAVIMVFRRSEIQCKNSLPTAKIISNVGVCDNLRPQNIINILPIQLEFPQCRHILHLPPSYLRHRRDNAI